MPLFDSARRVVAGLLAIAQTRAELLTVELEEEAQRLFSYLLLSLVALFCFGLAILLAVLLIVVLYWDCNRVAVIACLTAFFGLAAVVIGLGVRNCYRNKPRFLASTLDEISKDVEILKPSNQEKAP